MTAQPSISPASARTTQSEHVRAALKAALDQAPRRDAAQAALRAAAALCRDELARRWTQTQHADRQAVARGGQRRVHYLSMEFLIGRALGNALQALGLHEAVGAALAERSVDLHAVIEAEADAALGNGGLGRLAACFLDSLAELGLPAFGYGLRYQYGMFAQQIRDGAQAEQPDDWLAQGDPWSIPRPELHYTLGFGGRVMADGGGRRWEPAERIRAEAHDFVVPAHHGEHVATLRLWQASAAEPIDLAALSRGDLLAAGQHRLQAEALNWVLYPDDSQEAGRVLRLKQEYLLVSASLQDLLARHLEEGGRIHELGLRSVVHLNDTHPALAPAELMRLLLDEHGLPWDEAWSITRQACSYTNHTLMPEALETWPVRLFEALLPRHLEIIYEINQRFLDDVRSAHPGDEALIRRVSLIDDAGERRVRMAALAILASHRVNGVAALHSKLMVQTIFRDYAMLFPDRFTNVTNGVTPRRWLAQCNPRLAALLDTRIGRDWRQDLDRLCGLLQHADDPAFGQQLMAVKQANKQRLAERIRRDTGTVVDPASLFDVQIKRIHEYKRQLLNLLHVVARYQAMLAQPEGPDGAGWTPRTVILAGKAASAYHTAKQIIRLAHDIARVVNSDARLEGRLKLVFLPNYGVSAAEQIIPAADLSEQISTAGTEASGTGNMKFALNGALTLGTWDGATIEMAEAIGEEQVFIFGLRTEALQQLAAQGHDPRLYVEEQPRLARVLQAIAEGAFSAGDAQRYRTLVDGLLQRDRYFLLADFADYWATQLRVDSLYRRPAAWAARCARNIAGMGRFSTDRTIAEYRERIWSPARAQATREEALRPQHAR